MLDCRGWLEPVLDRSLAVIPAGHFAGLPLDHAALDTAYPHQIGIPQARVDRLDGEPGEAVLVRPDGHVCWAGRDDDAEGLHLAPIRWFGALTAGIGSR